MANLTPKGYTTIDDIEAYLLIDIQTYFEPQVSNWIAEVEKFIDKVTGRNFIADESASKRYYDGEGNTDILVDDFIEATEIKLGNDDSASTFTSADERQEYFLCPNNAIEKEAPYYEIKLKSSVFPRGNQNIEVTAKWGYSAEVPADIRLVATMLVSDIIEESMSAEGEVQSMSIGRYSVSYKTEERWQGIQEVKDMIQNYRAYRNF